MTTINPNHISNDKNFKQIESDSWTSLYLPAICAAILMAGVLFLAVSCSKKSDNVAKINPPAQPAVSGPPASTPVASLPETPKKAVGKKHRPANATYVNSTYGLSFSYPKKYSLQSGDKLGSAPLAMSFLKPGAAQVVSVDMPSDMYPETDFSSALLNVSVNKNMTSDECMQFVPAAKDAAEVKPTTAKVGANEYTVFEQISGEGETKSDLKYFHLFKNNACYEFALDVDTTQKAGNDLAQVDRAKVFQKLEKILTTARVKDLQATEVENVGKASVPETPISDSNAGDSKTTDTKASDSTSKLKTSESTENAQAVTPEQK